MVFSGSATAVPLWLFSVKPNANSQMKVINSCQERTKQNMTASINMLECTECKMVLVDLGLGFVQMVVYLGCIQDGFGMVLGNFWAYTNASLCEVCTNLPGVRGRMMQRVARPICTISHLYVRVDEAADHCV